LTAPALEESDKDIDIRLYFATAESLCSALTAGYVRGCPHVAVLHSRLLTALVP
jgi:hypothetical protein